MLALRLMLRLLTYIHTYIHMRVEAADRGSVMHLVSDPCGMRRMQYVCRERTYTRAAGWRALLLRTRRESGMSGYVLVAYLVLQA